MPAAFHALRPAGAGGQQQAQGGDATAMMRSLGSGFGGQMQAAHRGQAGRIGQIDQHKGHRPRPQRLFRRPQDVFGPPRPGKEDAPRIAEHLQAGGIKPFGQPAGADPQDRACHHLGLPKDQRGKRHPGRAANLVHPRARQRQTQPAGQGLGLAGAVGLGERQTHPASLGCSLYVLNPFLTGMRGSGGLAVEARPT